jgi:hypothetical protein
MKKPGEFKAAQHRHKKQQEVYEAIQKVRIESEAFVTVKGVRLKLTPLPVNAYPPWALVKTRGRVRLAHLIHKDGLTACFVDRPGDYSGDSVRFPHENVLCTADLASN